MPRFGVMAADVTQAFDVFAARMAVGRTDVCRTVPAASMRLLDGRVSGAVEQRQELM
jgi:hypothetical protein